MATTETPDKKLIWIGRTKDHLREFPPEVQRTVGFNIREVQKGETPDCAKPMTDLGKGITGVMEIVEDFDKETYRFVYIAKLKNGIYALHAFHKKSKKGIATPATELDIIRTNYKKATELDAEG